MTARVFTLKINDQDVSGREDQTILEIARDQGIDIPTLCHLDGLGDVGACRLCLVEVKGSTKLQPACCLMPQEGMEVITNSPRLLHYRKMIIEMLFAEGNHICSVCVTNGHCELQNLAVHVGLDHVRMEPDGGRRGVDASHSRFALDTNRCVLCTRCVRACDEIEGAHTWDVKSRGIESRVITDMNEAWGSSATCTSCGKCVYVCPTGALFEKGKSTGEMARRADFLRYLAGVWEKRK